MWSHASQVAPDKTPRAIAVVARSWDDNVSYGLALSIGAGLGIPVNQSLTTSLVQALTDAYNLVSRCLLQHAVRCNAGKCLFLRTEMDNIMLP
jgi:hypothetical protein